MIGSGKIHPEIDIFLKTKTINNVIRKNGVLTEFDVRIKSDVLIESDVNTENDVIIRSHVFSLAVSKS
jgi:hypothetical protein